MDLISDIIRFSIRTSLFAWFLYHGNIARCLNRLFTLVCFNQHLMVTCIVVVYEGNKDALFVFMGLCVVCYGSSSASWSSATQSWRSTATWTRRPWTSLWTSQSRRRSWSSAKTSSTAVTSPSWSSWTCWSCANTRPSSSPSNRYSELFKFTFRQVRSRSKLHTGTMSSRSNLQIGTMSSRSNLHTGTISSRSNLLTGIASQMYVLVSLLILHELSAQTFLCKRFRSSLVKAQTVICSVIIRLLWF